MPQGLPKASFHSARGTPFHAVYVWGLDHKKSWAPKNWCFWTVVLEKTLESPLDCKEIKTVNCKGDQSWMFIGRIDAEAEAPITWPLDVKTWLIGKGPDAGKDWTQEKGMTEDEMAGWHHQLDGHEFEQAPGVGDGQGSLVCCRPWGCKESDTTERLNWLTEGVHLPETVETLLECPACKSVCRTELLCCRPKTNTTLLNNCAPI